MGWDTYASGRRYGGACHLIKLRRMMTMELLEVIRNLASRAAQAVRRGLAIHVAAALLFACGGDGESNSDLVTQHAGNPECSVSPRGSSWIPLESTRYELTSHYGREPGEELRDVWGVDATRDGHVLVWDAGGTQVVRLSEDLTALGTSGREGVGPGEFVYQQTVHGDWIAAGDSSFIVVGLGTGIISEFGLDGRFIRNPTLTPPFPVPILGIRFFRGRILYGVDNVDRRGGGRTLETWQLEPQEPHTLLRSDQMPTLPLWRGRPVFNVHMQANPSWALGEQCVFVSDGGSDWVVAASVSSGRTDTLRLPDRPPIEPTEPDLAQWEREWNFVRRMGVAPAGIERVEPTLRAKWSDMIVDPDGFLWVEPWHPPSLRDDPMTAVIINPSNGAVLTVNLPRFPDAFLPGGGFVSVTTDGILPVVEKYVVR
jgi:hypothetical protein